MKHKLTILLFSCLAWGACKVDSKLSPPVNYWDPNFNMSLKHVMYNNPAGESEKDRITLVYALKEVIVEWKDESGNPVDQDYYQAQIEAGLQAPTNVAGGWLFPPIPDKFSPGDPNYDITTGLLFKEAAPDDTRETDGNGQPLNWNWWIGPDGVTKGYYYYDYSMTPDEPAFEYSNMVNSVTVNFYMPHFVDYNDSTSPSRVGQSYYDFKGWSFQKDSEIRQSDGRLPSNLQSFLAPSAGEQFPQNLTQCVVYALWEENSGALSGKQRIEQLIDELASKQVGPAVNLKDEYVIGSGLVTDPLVPFEAAAEALANQMEQYMQEASRLVQGTERIVEVTIDELDETGKPKVEEYRYLYYDYGAMATLCDQIQELLDDPGWNSDAYLPSIINLQYAVYPQINDNTFANHVPGKPRVQSVTIGKDGTYEIELWGASGGHIWSKNDLPALGGKGGHVKGRIDLNKGQILKFFIGGEGEGTALADYNTDASGNKVFNALRPRYPLSSNPNNSNYTKTNTNNSLFWGAKPGGWNGGGHGGVAHANYSSGASGGGATDVRIDSVNGNSSGSTGWDRGMSADSTGTNAGTTSGLYNINRRVMVAAGGGGAGQVANVDTANTFWPGIRGGWADDLHISGAYSGSTNGSAKGSSPTDSAYLYSAKKANSEYYYYGKPFLLADEDEYISPNSNQKGKVAALQDWQGGPGADYTDEEAWEGGGGGGGGYKGGHSVAKYDNKRHMVWTASGGGGSNFMEVNITNTLPDATNYDAYKNDPEKDLRLNHIYGNGHATIRYVQPVNP
ncbi:MAG: hypothetical protein LBG79_04960 [Spirochaetaceae bacterium]|jgi:hypothetical protein|nr:hypothetical protein [Spirochaetaceae bacterium]